MVEMIRNCECGKGNNKIYFMRGIGSSPNLLIGNSSFSGEFSDFDKYRSVRDLGDIYDCYLEVIKR